MPTPIALDDVRRLLDDGAQLVVPREEYGEVHLPGAINLPLEELDAIRVERLDRSGPVIVYCHDGL